MKFSVFIGLIITLLSCAYRCSESSENSTGPEMAEADKLAFVRNLKIDRNIIEKALRVLSETPHPIGSDRQEQIAMYLKSQGESIGLDMQLDEFLATVPNPILLSNPNAPASITLQKTGINVIGRLGQPKPCTILLASHYDTKYFGSFTYRGANDSGSSSAALLGLAKALLEWNSISQSKCSYHFIWFDGEEAYLPNWNDGINIHPAKIVDNTYGSRSLASNLVPCESQYCLPTVLGGASVKMLILLDMIGSPNIKLTRDSNSSEHLLEQALSLDNKLNLSLFGTMRAPISDDHVPFQQLGIPVINFIDFHNLHFWHKPGDDIENIEYKSIEKALRLTIALILQQQAQL